MVKIIIIHNALARYLWGIVPVQIKNNIFKSHFIYLQYRKPRLRIHILLCLKQVKHFS